MYSRLMKTFWAGKYEKWNERSFLRETENNTTYKMKGLPLSFSFARFFWFVSRNLVFLLHLFLVCWDTSNFSARRIFAALGLFSFFSLSVGSGLVRSVPCIGIQDIPRLHLEEQLFLYWFISHIFTRNLMFSFNYSGLLSKTTSFPQRGGGVPPYSAKLFWAEWLHLITLGGVTLSLLIPFTHFPTLQFFFTSNFMISFKYFGLLDLALMEICLWFLFHFVFKSLPYFFPTISTSRVKFLQKWNIQRLPAKLLSLRHSAVRLLQKWKYLPLWVYF